MRFFVTAWLAATTAAIAQQPPADTTEVRKAIPVGAEPEVRKAEPVDPNSIQNPAWMDRIPRAEPVATPTPEPPAPEPNVQRAIPVERAEPVPPARPSEPPSDSPPPQNVPYRPPASELQTPDEEGDIRFAPAEDVPNMNQSLLAGNGFYRRRMYELAVPEYEKFLIAEPNAEGRDGALFRLGESHRALGNTLAAKNAYQRLLAEFREGEFIGAGAYRLGQIYFAEGNFPSAVGMFEKAGSFSDQSEIKLTAKFYEASGYDKIGKAKQAAKAYGELLAMEGENPYADTARFYLAEYESKQGSKQKAFDAYETLSKEAKEPKMQAEAAVKAGAIAADLGRNERAKELFDEALNMPGLGDWRGVARLGVIRLTYESGQYEQAAGISEEQIAELPDEAVPEALLLAANARRQLGRHAEAIQMYDRILSGYSQSPQADQAKFQRLVTLDASGAEGIENEIDRFLATSTNPRERAQATLLKAELLFKRGDYAGAAPMYAKILVSTLPKKLKDQSLYKLGWCQMQQGQNAEAAQSFTRYLVQNPKSDLAPTALAQRAMANQRGEAYEAAIKDFDKLIADYPKAKERELALQQKALILGQQGNQEEMVAAFRQLLEEYPESKAAAQAHYWTGTVSFDRKDYEKALPALEKARDLDPDGFGKRAMARILLVHYYAEDMEAVEKEASKAEPGAVPAQVLVWLGSKYLEQGDNEKAEKFLGPLLNDPSAPVDPELLLSLAKARIALGKFVEAREPVQRYLAQARDPLTRAKALLASAEISLGTGNYEDANKLVEEALLLQPEGKYNAEGRLLSGEVLMQRGDYEGAAKAFMMVAVLYDDETITPRALKRGADAYRKAGNSAEARRAMDELGRRFPEESDSPDTAQAEARRQ